MLNLVRKLLWGLARVQDFVIEEPLASRLEESTGPGHDVYVALWQIRILAEMQDEGLDAFIRAVVRWITMSVMTLEDDQALKEIGITRRIQPEERMDMVNLLFTIATQNGYKYGRGRRPVVR